MLPQPVEWSAYNHAYGTANDIAKTLEALKSARASIRENALDHLFFTIYHQGDIYSATAPAVEALILLAANQATADRPNILGLVEVIAESAARLPGQFTEEIKHHHTPNCASDHSHDARANAEKGFREIALPVQVAFASQRAALEKLLCDQDGIVVDLAKRIFDIVQEFPYSDLYEPVYRGLKLIEYDTVTAFALDNPTMTFGQLASHLGKRVSTLQVWWVLLAEAEASGNIEALARSALVREIRAHTRERGWGVSIHFERIHERIEFNWFSHFPLYPDSCEAVWALLTRKAEKGWLPQSSEDPVIRACFDEGWRKR